jgi:hypothetical protein
MAMVRRYYNVPAKRGREVLFIEYKHPVRGTIISATGSHLYLRDSNGRRLGPCHPLGIDYLDGVSPGDREARHNDRIRKFNEMLNAPERDYA